MNSIRVLHLTSYNEDCGIAKYQEQFIEGMGSEVDIVNTVYDVSPYVIKKMKPSLKSKLAEDVANKMSDYDILHIQHEFGFYDGNELAMIIDQVSHRNKKIIVTMHTSLKYSHKPVKRGGIGPRSILAYVREKRALNKFIQTRFEPVKHADLIVVHNNATRLDLIENGVGDDRIRVIRHPVRSVNFEKASRQISDNLNKTEKEIIVGAVGFPSSRKGSLDIIKALSYLPKNYKLAVIGGVHPSGENEPLIDKMCDLAHKRGVADRIYITGFVKDDDELNSLIREADVCVYPYTKAYYDHVSSGALNHAIGNHVPVIAYPTSSFIETNSEIPVIQFTKSFNYYELARSIQNIDMNYSRQLSIQYAELYNWPQEAKKFAQIYRDV